MSEGKGKGKGKDVSGTWYALDMPAYEIDDTVEKPWRDEDVAMTMSHKLGKDLSYQEACRIVGCYLDDIADMNHVMRSAEDGMYRAASALFIVASHQETPVDIMVRLHGRVYTVKNTK